MPRVDKQKDKEYQKIWAKNNPDKVKAYAKKYREKYPDKQKEAMRKWRQSNPDYRKKYYQSHKEIELRQTSQYQKSTPELQKIYQKRHYLKNKSVILRKKRETYTKNERKTRYELNKEHYLLTDKLRRIRLHSILVWHYSKGTYRCACCGFGEGRIFLEIDHLNGFGNKHRNAIGTGNFHNWIIKNKLPKAYQVLCSNCNRAKFRNRGICPHKEDPNNLLSKTNI